MAQAATMGPPLSPRETRRSGRRSAPSVSATSKSPDSDHPPRQKEPSQRPSIPISSSNPRNKRPKMEDIDDSVDDRRSIPASTTPTASVPLSTNGKQKRKTKDKEKPTPLVDPLPDISTPPIDEPPPEAQEEEEQGITRCVCGSTEDDPDAGEFMVQCETCKVWQHGLCMGYQSEDQVHDDDYYCEQCRPELHVELLKRLAKKTRHSSATGTAPSRVSRSHSPSHLLKQPSKRRNTMNSRDAAFDESLKEIIEATAAEAAAVNDTVLTAPSNNANTPADLDPDVDSGSNNRKKRKRTEDDGTSKKRTRSASSASERQESVVATTEVPVNGSQSKPLTSAVIPPPSKVTGRIKRGGRKSAAAAAAAAAEIQASVEGDEGVTSNAPKRQGGNGRTKGSNTAKRPPLSHVASHGPGSTIHEHGTRRNQSGTGASGQHAGSSAAESSRAYRNSHAYAVSQQPLFTSWGLPDYLAHLEQMLPTDTPQPLEVRASVRGESVDRTTERGVKVKWPSKRMSVGDMNKRVRALVEWVGREQASALDRDRRKGALEKALKEEGERLQVDGDGDIAMSDGVVMPPPSGQEKPSKRTPAVQPSQEDEKSTMRLMEELMEELIGFQERFGLGAKNRERERRLAAAAGS
ncbi:hypothetical protein BDQ12DRAFT_695150 [Crucibulum laeve]|uniref:PHD-type domain-containing protein n=1 Tax=Crucibulum laeve TaxID=68775 RepID=A0A5C3MLC0_9AGAR|nr:hypothetical protein BDQ12DRAFT_695150 [Crucibulum laeve]